jgi:hypothetical protein
VEIDDVPDSLATVLALFKGTQVNVDYMYALAGTGLSTGTAVMVFRFSDNDKAIGILLQNKVRILDAEAFGIMEQAG